MNTSVEIDAERVPAETVSHATQGFAERMVIRLLEKMPLGGLRMEYSDGRVRHFGKPGAPVTARVVLRDEAAFFKRCAFYGNIGMGEAYTDGLWDTPDIAAVISWFIHNVNALQGADSSSASLPGVNLLKIVNWFRHLRRENSVETSRRNISEHYDLGNEFYGLWLDPSMTYSSARFESAEQSLEDAQRGKYDALCRKLKLKPTDHVLEIGCGWGGFAVHAARNYGCKITGVTISEAQAAYARKRVADEGLENQIEIRIQDYRHITGQFRQDRFDRNAGGGRRQVSPFVLREVRGGADTGWLARCPDDHGAGLQLPQFEEERGLDSKAYLPRLAAAQRGPHQRRPVGDRGSVHARPRRPRGGLRPHALDMV